MFSCFDDAFVTRELGFVAVICSFLEPAVFHRLGHVLVLGHFVQVADVLKKAITHGSSPHRAAITELFRRLVPYAVCEDRSYGRDLTNLLLHVSEDGPIEGIYQLLLQMPFDDLDEHPETCGEALYEAVTTTHAPFFVLKSTLRYFMRRGVAIVEGLAPSDMFWNGDLFVALREDCEPSSDDPAIYALMLGFHELSLGQVPQVADGGVDGLEGKNAISLALEQHFAGDGHWRSASGGAELAEEPDQLLEWEGEGDFPPLPNEEPDDVMPSWMPRDEAGDERAFSPAAAAMRKLADEA
jgi:hypothetical protein